MSTTFTLVDGYDRRKAPPAATYRYMTPEEARQLRPGSHATMRANDGTARTVKINGAPRTWKRDPSRLEVPVKYGMYECATFEARPNGTVGTDCATLVVKVEELES